MENISEYLPILIPLAVLQLGLMITALVHILRHNTYKAGNRAVWIVVVLLVNYVGPVAYFIFGRSDEE